MGCSKSKPKCVICTGKVNHMLWPCGHFCLCADCTVELSKYRRGPNELKVNLNLDECKGVQCPVCRCIAVPTKVFYPLCE